MREIRAITLDLDDTLWSIGPVILAAELAQYEWLREQCPEITETYEPEDLRILRLDFAARNPDLQFDVTALRCAFLRELFAANNHDAELAEPCFEVFLEARNRVSLFPDVLPTLQRLTQHFALASISNGNADLGAIGLSGYFVEQVTARDIGVAKPHRRMFLAACEAVHEAPEHTVHIGDHPTQDIWGAAQIGMHTIWVNRDDTSWEHEHRADAQVSSLEEILTLLNID